MYSSRNLIYICEADQSQHKVQDSQEAQAQPPTSMGGPNPPWAHAM